MALCGDEVAGLIWIYRDDTVSRLFRFGEGATKINNGCVLPTYGRGGLFTSVLVHSSGWLSAHGYRTVYAAAVHSTNAPSRRAIRSAGFHEIGSVWSFLFYRPRFRAITWE